MLLAIAAYLLLHPLATRPLPIAAAQAGQTNALLMDALLRGAASVGQYVLPILCLAGAAMSAWRRRERRQLTQGVAQSRTADVLDGMTWQQFERLVGEAFRLQGYGVEENGGGGADGGIDLVLTRDGEKALVQCKQWRAYKVGVGVVRELYGVMAAEGASAGFVVTSGRFTDDASRFADGRNIALIDGTKLHGLIRQVQGDAAARDGRARPDLPADVATTAPALACPQCAKAMTRRTARRGANAGKDFWGCTAYPDCKGTRALG